MAGADLSRSLKHRIGLHKSERAGDHVGMAVQIFGGRVHNHVGAEVERAG